MAYRNLRFEEPQKGIGLVVMNRPERLNAINYDVLEDFHQLYEDLCARVDIRVVVLTGEGRAFCSGADLKDDRTLGEGGANFRAASIHLEKVQKRFSRVILELRRLPQPVIAAVRGAAAGGGMCLALASDIIFAAPSARFIPAFINIGLSGGELGTSFFLPRLVGMARAAEILMTGRTVDGEEAARIGMVSRLTGEGNLMEEAMRMAEILMSKSRFGLRMTKEALNFGQAASSLEHALEFENRNQSMGCCDPDFMRAVTDFAAGNK